MRLMTSLTPLVLVLACGEKDPSDNSTDTGSVEEEEINYESGCFVVDGGDGYRYLNDAIAVADEGAQISPVGCTEFEHEELIVIDKSIRLVGIGQDRFTLVAPVNETAITITADNVEISDFAIQSTRSGISVEGGNNVHLHDLTISEVGNYAIKSSDADVQLDDLTLWNNGDGAINVNGGSVTASGLDVRGNEGYGIMVDGAASLTLSDSQVVETQPTDPAAISDGFGVFLDGGSTLVSSNNVYDGNTLIGVQSVNGSIEMNGDTVTNSLSTGVWAEGQGSLSMTDVTVEGNLTYGVINMTTGGFTVQDVLVTVDPLMTPSYDVESWEDNGFGSMGVFSNAPSVDITNLEITGYNNCGMNVQTDGSTGFSVEGLNVHDIGRKGIIIAGHNGTMNNVVIKDILDLDGLSSKEPDENGVVADYTTFCQLVDRNAGATVVNADVTVSNVLTQNVQGYGWSVIQANMVLDTAFAQDNTCSSFLAFQGGIQGTNVEVASNNYEYDGLGAGVVGYAATLFSMENSTFRGTTGEVGDISAFLYETTGYFTNNTFTGGGMGIYSNASAVESSGNIFTEQNAYSVYLSSSLPSGSEHSFENDQFIATPSEDFGGNTTPIYCFDAGTIGVSGTSFTDVRSIYAAMYMSDCSSEIENTTFDQIDSYSVYGFNGDHDISDVIMTSVNETTSYYDAFSFIATEPMNLSITDTTITDGVGGGMYAYSTDATNAPLNVNISGLEMNNMSDDGVTINNGTVFIEDLVIDGADQGINISNSTLSMSDVEISNTTESGIRVASTDTTADTVSIATSASHGFDVSGGSMLLSNAQTDGSAEAGLYASNGADISIDSSSFQNGQYGVNLEGTDVTPVTFAITNSTFSLNSESGAFLTYANGTFDSSFANNNQNLGMECSVATFTSCASNDLTSNLSGEQSGCDETCGVEANPTE